jgi:hypothetical protein
VIPNLHPKYQVSLEPELNQLKFSSVDSGAGTDGPYGLCLPAIPTKDKATKTRVLSLRKGKKLLMKKALYK